MSSQKPVIKILAICGSTRENSVNELILGWMARRYENQVTISIYNKIASLPHFKSDEIEERAPLVVKALYEQIGQANGVIICTPEYVFSLPGSMKNLLDWTVSTTLFNNKPTATIVASSSGEKAYESLNLIMKTLGAQTEEDTRLLVSAVKTKVDIQGNVHDKALVKQLDLLAETLFHAITSPQNS